MSDSSLQKHDRLAIGRAWMPLAGMLAMLLGGCQRMLEFSPQPAPRFTGKSIPAPPLQGAPWVPPETKLPKFLLSATAALFAQGVADPRGCDYRVVEVGEWHLIMTKAFVLPQRPGEAGRFAVGWDGVIRPAFSIGGAADLEADVRSAAGSGRRDQEQAEGRGVTVGITAPGEFEPSESGAEPCFGTGQSMTINGHSPLKVCILLRLGRADLAEIVFAGGTSWSPATPRRDLTDYRINYLTLANDWAAAVYARLLSAHQRGDDVVALDAGRRLDAFRKAVDVKAEAMGFVRSVPHPHWRVSGEAESPAYIHGFELLDPLLADQERRAKEPPRGPIPQPGGDPAARIAALIRAFDQIHAVQQMSPGPALPADDSLVRDVIAEGEPAIEPLLTALASDARLTRSMSGRGMTPQYVHPVSEVIYEALRALLKTDRFLSDGTDRSAWKTPEGRKRVAAAVRACWEKSR